MAHDLDTALSGISGILVTPYNANGEAPNRLTPIIDRALGAGVHILVVNGNTGEFYALTTDEACTMVREVAGLVEGRAPLLVGVGRGVRDACRLARASADAGAAALMIHQPPDPFVAPRGIVDYVEAVSDASGGLPIMLYLRNDAIGTRGIEALCALPGGKGSCGRRRTRCGWPRRLPRAIRRSPGSAALPRSGRRRSMRWAPADSPPGSSTSGRNARWRYMQHLRARTTRRLAT